MLGSPSNEIFNRLRTKRLRGKLYQTGSEVLFFAQRKDQGKTWVPLVEKTYAQAHGGYASLERGWGEGLGDLTGALRHKSYPLASTILNASSKGVFNTTSTT
jgi:hypothetical protein